jgi:hypothetical protein
MVCAPSVKRGFFPLDEELELVAGHFTPRVYEDITRLATWMPFGQAVKEAGHYLHITLSEATVRRQSEAAGAAYVALQTRAVEALEGGQNAEAVAGVAQQFISVDGAFVPVVGGEWVEVKTLAIGTVQAPREVKGEQVIQTTALSYFSRLADATTFQRLALVETERRGLSLSAAVAAVTDGAEWCQGFVDFQRFDAVRILDFPHAAEHLNRIGQAAFAQDVAGQKQWVTEQCHDLKHTGPTTVLATVQQLAQAHPDHPELNKALTYLLKRQAQLAYPAFQAAGWPIGDGAVESANKLVVEYRLKGSGMHWAPAHVNPMLALRNLAVNDRWAEAWPQIHRERRRLTAHLTATRRQQRLANRPAPQPPPPSLGVPSPTSRINPAPPATPPRLPTPLAPAAPPPADQPKPPYRPSASHPWRKPFLLNTKPQTTQT